MSNTGMIKELNTLKSKLIKTITIFYPGIVFYQKYIPFYEHIYFYEN